jgi:hypothetical protein
MPLDDTPEICCLRFESNTCYDIQLTSESFGQLTCVAPCEVISRSHLTRLPPVEGI